MQSLNAKVPILVTLFGSVMLSRLEQPLKVYVPTLVTLFGMDILARLEQFENARYSKNLVFSFISQDSIEVSVTFTRTRCGLVSFPR